MVNLMWKVIDKVEARKFPMNRISLHAINFHMLCFDRSVWRAGKDSVASSIAVSLQIAGGYSKENFKSIKEDLSKLRFNFPESLLIKTKRGSILKSKEDLVQYPVFNFYYGKLQVTRQTLEMHSGSDSRDQETLQNQRSRRQHFSFRSHIPETLKIPSK